MGSQIDLDNLLDNGRRYWLAVGGEAFEVPTNCLGGVLQGFRMGVPLRNTAGQRGDLGHEYAVFVLLN